MVGASATRWLVGNLRPKVTFGRRTPIAVGVRRSSKHALQGAARADYFGCRHTGTIMP